MDAMRLGERKGLVKGHATVKVIPSLASHNGI